jgi:hypothetical protein
MPTQPDQTGGSLTERMRGNPGLAALVAEAEATWRDRAVAAGVGDVDDSGEMRPAWRAFEDSFPTFYEFTNRPK